MEETIQTIQETGEIALHLIEALNSGEITEEQYIELKRELLGV